MMLTFPDPDFGVIRISPCTDAHTPRGMYNIPATPDGHFLWEQSPNGWGTNEKYFTSVTAGGSDPSPCWIENV